MFSEAQLYTPANLPIVRKADEFPGQEDLDFTTFNHGVIQTSMQVTNVVFNQATGAIESNGELAQFSQAESTSVLVRGITEDAFHNLDTYSYEQMNEKLDELLTTLANRGVNPSDVTLNNFFDDETGEFTGGLAFIEYEIGESLEQVKIEVVLTLGETGDLDSYKLERVTVTRRNSSYSSTTYYMYDIGKTLDEAYGFAQWQLQYLQHLLESGNTSVTNF